MRKTQGYDATDNGPAIDRSNPPERSSIDVEKKVKELVRHHISRLQKLGVPISDDGYLTRLAVVQESGFQCGPSIGYEQLISEFIPCDDEDFGKQWVAKMNRRADLPYYLAKVQVKVLSMEKYTDSDLGDLPPLED